MLLVEYGIEGKKSPNPYRSRRYDNLSDAEWFIAQWCYNNRVKNGYIYWATIR